MQYTQMQSSSRAPIIMPISWRDKNSEYLTMEIWSYYLYTFYLGREKEHRALHKTVTHWNITHNPKELTNVTNTGCTVTAWTQNSSEANSHVATQIPLLLWICRFITMFVTVHHWSLSWGTWIQPISPSSHPI